MIVMIISLCVLLISMGILVPFVFSVHRTNDRVLSFFGFIPTGHLEELSRKCEIYMDRWLEDYKENAN